MAIREIVTTPDPILRQRARKVRTVTKEIQTLMDDMVETMRVEPGVGLAAPQVGVSQRVIVVEFAEASEDPEVPPKPPKLYAVANPEIVRHSSDTEIANEGCLSIPGYIGEVERYSSVTVKGLNRHGEPFRLKAQGWLARIFQHEINHLDGVLFIDLATQVRRLEDLEIPEEIPTV
ncbi:MAG: peptide deformylase [Chloroflexi bacterium RBG_16_48_8]|nr:MAG: peptide deformylase [Chloroflexi bacterium RBG_16_48_8]